MFLKLDDPKMLVSRDILGIGSNDNDFRLLTLLHPVYVIPQANSLSPMFSIAESNVNPKHNLLDVLLNSLLQFFQRLDFVSSSLVVHSPPLGNFV